MWGFSASPDICPSRKPLHQSSESRVQHTAGLPPSCLPCSCCLWPPCHFTDQHVTATSSTAISAPGMKLLEGGSTPSPEGGSTPPPQGGSTSSLTERSHRALARCCLECRQCQRLDPCLPGLQRDVVHWLYFCCCHPEGCRAHGSDTPGARWTLHVAPV